MLVSVIIPVFNVENYLRDCIESILNQTFRDFEIILIDDGSTDSCPMICDEYAASYSNISVIHKKNAGLGNARNEGIDHAKGRYITFIDSDDYVDSYYLKDLVFNIETYQGDVCLGGFKKVNNNRDILFTEIHKFKIYNYDGIVNEAFVRMLGSLPEKKDSIRMSVCNTLFRTDILNSYKLRFVSEREYISEDLLFNLEYYRHVKKCIIIGSSHYNYRDNNNSLTTSYKRDRFDLTIKFFKYLDNKLKEYHFKQECFLRMKKLFFVYLRVCINQEKVEISKNSFIKSLANIRTMCSNDYVQEVIRHYPYKKLGFKQKVFIVLLKMRCTLFLYFFV